MSNVPEHKNNTYKTIELEQVITIDAIFCASMVMSNITRNNDLIVL